MKQVLILLFIMGVVSINFSYKSNIPNAPKLIIKSDTDNVSFLKNKVWLVHPNVDWADTVHYMYIDSSLNLFLLSNVDDPLRSPYVFAEKYQKSNIYVFVNGRRETFHSEIRLTVNNTGKIIECFATGVCLVPCKAKSFNFSATELNITCCTNHYPVRHCCKSFKEMADTTKVYKCIW